MDGWIKGGKEESTRHCPAETSAITYVAAFSAARRLRLTQPPLDCLHTIDYLPLALGFPHRGTSTKRPLGELQSVAPRSCDPHSHHTPREEGRSRRKWAKSVKRLTGGNPLGRRIKRACRSDGSRRVCETRPIPRPDLDERGRRRCTGIAGSRRVGYIPVAGACIVGTAPMLRVSTRAPARINSRMSGLLLVPLGRLIQFVLGLRRQDNRETHRWSFPRIRASTSSHGRAA